MNLTHESDLGSHRVGEQKGIMTAILNIILKCPDCVLESDKFDISIMALSLIINLIEHSSVNCHLLESVSLDDLVGPSSEATPSQARCNGSVAPRGSVLRALVQLFLKLIAKADSAVIEVPTPQRSSQISNSSPHSSTGGHSSQGSSPGKTSSGQRGGASSCKANLSARLSENVKGYSTSEDLAASQKWHRKARHPLGKATRAGKVGVASDDEEECEPIDMDNLVFDRDAFNSALDQAERQMEDSIFSSYLALVLGIVAEKDFDMVDVIRSLMPSGTFSEMLKMLKQFVSFMSMTGSDVGLESIRHTIKYLEALQPSA